MRPRSASEVAAHFGAFLKTAIWNWTSLCGGSCFCAASGATSKRARTEMLRINFLIGLNVIPRIVRRGENLLFEHALPFLQRGINSALRQQTRPGCFNLQHLVSLFVDSKLQASTPISVTARIRSHPLARFKGRPRPITRHLVTALNSYGPFGVSIGEPNICGRRIAEPSATRFEIGWPAFGRQTRRSDCEDRGQKNQAASETELKFHMQELSC